MIKVEFTPELFDAIYEGIVVGSACTPPNERGFAQLQHESSLINKLWTVSKPAECGRKFPTGDIARELNFGQAIEFTPEEFALILKFFRNTIWAITRTPAVMIIWDLLIKLAEGNKEASMMK